jgi:DNA-binding HxlR family transcriptional regulator
MSLPIPGKPVRGSKTGQPIMALLDLLGRSWALGIIWHLYKGPNTFRKLQEYCESISPTTLNKRIRELTDAYLIERSLGGYKLTEQGVELYELIAPLGGWAKEWSENFKPEAGKH